MSALRSSSLGILARLPHDGCYGSGPAKKDHQTAKGTSQVFFSRDRGITLSGMRTEEATQEQKESIPLFERSHNYNLMHIFPGNSENT